MTKATAKAGKPKGPKVTDAGVPAPLPPRSAEEEALVAAWRTSPRLDRPPKFEKAPSGGLRLMGDFELAHARLDRLICGNNGTYTGHMLGLVANSLGISDPCDAGNVAVAMVHAISPRDPVEALLASQMVAAHDAAMEMLRRSRIPEQPSDIVDSCINRATRLMRSVTAQVTALKDYRSKGHQTVTVQHVDIRDGGQAIVGDVVLQKPGMPGGGGRVIETAKRIPERRRGGQPANRNAVKHGQHTARAKAERAWIRLFLRESRRHLKSIRELTA